VYYITGAVQLKINQGNMNRIPRLVATRQIHDAFQEKIIPLLDKTRILDEESRTLAETRDALLPRLVGGALRVWDVDL
jgi:type I restriction enzyme S subunit